MNKIKMLKALYQVASLLERPDEDLSPQYRNVQAQIAARIRLGLQETLVDSPDEVLRKVRDFVNDLREKASAENPSEDAFWALREAYLEIDRASSRALAYS